MQSPKWSEILGNVEKTLAQVVHSLEEANKGHKNPEEYSPNWEKSLAQFSHRFEQLHALACRGDLAVNRTDQILEEEETQIRILLREIEGCGEKLAQWTGRAVG